MMLHYYRLFRPRLALLNGVTALAGYGLFPDHIRVATLLAAFIGVTLLAMGGSALNQLLERDIDALMTRTMLRPLPQKELSTTTALYSGICLILAGLAPLSITGGLLPPFLGVAALAWYLGVYTPLKRRTTLALPLGAISGAIPPLIGWCLAGGSPTDYRIIALAGLLFIWQIPHFWLLQERYKEDYTRAGIPIIGIEETPISKNSLFMLWLTAFIAIAMLLPTLNIIASPAADWFAFLLVPLIVLALMRSGKALFMYLNLYPLLVTMILLAHT